MTAHMSDRAERALAGDDEQWDAAETELGPVVIERHEKWNAMWWDR